MPWLAPKVAVVDQKGYLFCAHCVNNFGLAGRAVYGDSCIEENCDKCGALVKRADSANYVHVSSTGINVRKI